MTEIAALVSAGKVVNVAVADADWADDNGYIAVNETNSFEKIVNIGDTYDEINQKFIPFGWTYDSILGEFVKPNFGEES